MVMDLTFESACKIVKDEHPELVPDIDAFLNIALTTGVTTLAVPIAVASGATTLTPALIILTAIGTLSNLFGVKNEIFKVGERIISKITSKREQNAHEQYMCMQHAYTLICYVAFFESLAGDKQLAPLLKKIKMKPEEKISTAIVASKDLWGQPSAVTDDHEITQGKMAVFKYEIAMPQPGDTFETQRQYLAPLYEELAKRVAVFFELETIKPYVQSEQEKIKQALTELPKKALDTFVAQYNTLAMKFPEFAVWLNLQKDDKIIRLTEQSRQLLESISQVEQRQTNAVLRLLANHHRSIVDGPIIDDPDSELTYPKKRDIFILQSFKVTHYKSTEQLKESFWNSLPERHDLEDFLRAYFNHEESSTKTPLIILGQPGSGKSLLTSMIAAQLIPLPFTPIKVELRRTNAENPISIQIEEQIRRGY
jgi:NACHT N-terminal Helical domain 7